MRFRKGSKVKINPEHIADVCRTTRLIVADTFAMAGGALINSNLHARLMSSVASVFSVSNDKRFCLIAWEEFPSGLWVDAVFLIRAKDSK